MATLREEDQISKRAIDRAGTIGRDWYLSLREDEADIENIPSDVLDALLVISAYRKSFAPTLKNVTVGVRQFVQRESGQVLVSQRLKRLPTILDKLARHRTMKLTRMQDIGGCRAILPGGVTEIAGVLRRMQKNSWQIARTYDYIVSPKDTGYRAVHVIAERSGRLIEVQLRTERQHQWAAEVERTGGRLVLPRLKDGEGPIDLVRYFERAAYMLALQDSGLEPDNLFWAEFENLRGQVRGYWQPR